MYLGHVLRKLTWRTHDGIFPKQSGLALPKVIRGLCEGFSVAVHLFASEITIHLRDLNNCVGGKSVYSFLIRTGAYLIRMIMCVQSRCRFCTLRFRQQHLVQKDGQTGV